jgi:hypothetical protein
MFGNLFGKTLLTRKLHQTGGCGLLRDELFCFRPRHGTSLQLSRLVEEITRNFGEKRLTGAVWPKPSIPCVKKASFTS